MKLAKWPLLEQIGAGGNGKVWRSEVKGVAAAIKVLTRPDRVSRFRDEVEGMRRLADVQGVLPVLDYEIPDFPTKSHPAWFAMPLAKPLLSILTKSADLREVVTAIRDLANVMQIVHARGFSHRDLKPDNLFFYEGRWTVGDFGLIWFEGKAHQTAIGEKVGPQHFIAPEMLVGIADADGRPADVFSLAKVLWVLATGMTFPLPGAYLRTSQMCQLASYVVGHRTTSLDAVIERCTVIEPDARISMQEFCSELSAWLDPAPQTTEWTLDLQLEPQWQEVANAADLEKQRVAAHNALYARRTQALESIQMRIMERLGPLRAVLETAHLVQIDGPDRNTTPIGVTAWLPERTDSRQRVGLDIRIRAGADWERLDNETGTAGLYVYLLERGRGEARDLIHQSDGEFLFGAPSEEKTIDGLVSEIEELLSGWVAMTRHRWSHLV